MRDRPGVGPPGRIYRVEGLGGRLIPATPSAYSLAAQHRYGVHPRLTRLHAMASKVRPVRQWKGRVVEGIDSRSSPDCRRARSNSDFGGAASGRHTAWPARKAGGPG